jgi:hypothetical protein
MTALSDKLDLSPIIKNIAPRCPKARIDKKRLITHRPGPVRPNRRNIQENRGLTLDGPSLGMCASRSGRGGENRQNQISAHGDQTLTNGIETASYLRGPASRGQPHQALARTRPRQLLKTESGQSAEYL